jgi:hypothetical protein
MFFATFNWLFLTLFAMISLVLLITYNHVKDADQDKYVYCLKCNDKFDKTEDNFTAGYYDCSDGYWAEISGVIGTLCDNCMWHTEGYVKRYGVISPGKVQPK